MRSKLNPRLLLGLLAAMLGGCVLGPADGSSFSSRTSMIPFVGYAGQSGAAIEIECRNVASGIWISIGGDNADISPANSGEARLLYNFYAQVQVPNGCWEDQVEFGFRARVRVREPSANYVKQLYTFNQAGIACLNTELADGEEWVPAGSSCNTGNELTLFANS